MRKRFITLLSALLLFAVTIPTMAQGTIADVAAENDDLSILVDLIGVADPAIAETLSSSGDYTVLAPSNLAFRQLVDFLGLSLDDLRDNPQIVTDILLYHVIEGDFSADEIRSQYDGGVVPTLLDGAFLNFDVLEDGTIQVNDVAEVVVANVNASNGTVHVVNDVLLNRVITEQIEGVQLGINEADDTEEAAETETPATDDEMMAEAGFVRFVHAVPDAPAVDVYVDGSVALESVPPATITDFAELGAGTYSIAVAPADTSLDDAVFGPTDVTLDAGIYATIAAVGSLEEGTLSAEIITQEFAPLDGATSVTVLHGIAGGPAVDVLVNGSATVEDLEFPNTVTFTPESGTYEVAVADATTGDVLIDPIELTLEADTYYLAVALVGTDGTPTLATATAAPMEMDDMGGTDEMGDTGEEDPVNEIDDIIAREDRFTILLGAVLAADESIINELGSSGPYTLFAPSNQAFNNLLATLDMSLEEVAADEDLLNQVLLYHVLPGEFTAADLAEMSGESIETLLDDQAISITAGEGGGVIVNGVVNVTEADIQADNGVIHIIDDVLLPQPVIEAMQGDS